MIFNNAVVSTVVKTILNPQQSTKM